MKKNPFYNLNLNEFVNNHPEFGSYFNIEPKDFSKNNQENSDTDYDFIDNKDDENKD